MLLMQMQKKMPRQKRTYYAWDECPDDFRIPFRNLSTVYPWNALEPSKLMHSGLNEMAVAAKPTDTSKGLLS